MEDAHREDWRPPVSHTLTRRICTVNQRSITLRYDTENLGKLWVFDWELNDLFDLLYPLLVHR